MRAVQIDVWSDYVCPFCYLAEPALEQLVAEEKGQVTLRWRAFELRPDPVPTLDPKGDYLREIWAGSVYPLARQRGMKLTLPPVQPRSRFAHEATAFAAARGKASGLAHAIFQAFFEHGTDIGRVEELAKLAAGAGLDPTEMTTALTSGRHRPEVLEDEELAREFGLSGVPAIVIRVVDAPWEQAVLVSGAQPCDVLRAAVAQVRAQAG
jgi:predicted DsbA family dithiol-disulfide isomerase